MRFIPFVVFMVFGWIFCCSCPCCCCSQTQKNQYICRLVSFVASLSLFVLIVALSSYGFFALHDIMKGLNGMSCTLFKLYIEILNGQAVEKTPKWTGVFGISETLNDIQATFDQIVQDKDEIFSGKNTFENNKLDFQNTLILSEYTAEVDALVIKYEKNGVNQTHKPLYVENYSPVETSDTSLYLINQEFETVIEEAEKLLNDSNTKADSIFSSSDTMRSSIDSINSIIVDFNTTLSEFSTSVAEPWMDYQELITKYGSLACNCFFGIL